VDDLILVTGGAGFIGSHLVEALLSTGNDVRVLDDFSTGRPENIRGAEALAAAHGGRFQLIAGDVRDEDKVREAVDGCAAVCHLAAVASVTQSVADPVGTGSVTHGGTVNVVRWAVDADVPRVVLASSCAVYGDAAGLPVSETSVPRPMSPYAEAKLASEQTCAAAADAGQIVAACLRLFNVFGPRQDPGSEYSGVISRFMAAAAAREPVTIYGDGEQTRDFTYIDNVVDANWHTANHPRAAGGVFNIGCGTQTSLNQLVAQVNAILGTRLEPVYEPARAGDVRHSAADVGKARDLLGYKPAISLQEGLERVLAWFRENKEAWNGTA
jgi:UDP-N-acetylglucosamine 4-epimerase